MQRNVRVEERHEGARGEERHVDAESPRQLDPDALGLMPRVIVHVIAPIEAGMTGLEKMRAWASKTDAGLQAER